MAKELDVLDAVKALIAATLPGMEVRGLDAKAAKPTDLGPDGLILVRYGAPSEPEVDLSPLTYNYDHPIPIEVATYETPSMTGARRCGEAIRLIGIAIQTNRTLSGLCDWLDAEAPTYGESETLGAKAITWADFMIVASYSTSNPLI